MENEHGVYYTTKVLYSYPFEARDQSGECTLTAHTQHSCPPVSASPGSRSPEL